MKIYGHFFSAPANQVRLTVSALGVDAQYIHVDLQKGEQRQPGFIAVNPFGRVPAMDDDGFTLGESGAISRYLASKSDSALYPKDIKARALIDQWMDYAALDIRANMAKVLFNKMFAPMMGQPVDEKSMADGQKALDAKLPAVEAALARSPYLVGASLTIADIAMIAAMEPFEMIGVDLAAYPHIRKWRDGIMTQGYYTKVHTRYGAEMAG